MTSDKPWPSVAEVEAKWVALVRGTLTREQVHEWTIPWVEGDGAGWNRGLGHVEDGVQTLHGFSMSYDPATPHLIHHGPPGVYVKTKEDIVAELARWMERR